MLITAAVIFQMLFFNVDFTASTSSTNLISANCSDSSVQMVKPAIPKFPKTDKTLMIQVAVNVSANGKVTSAKVQKSSGRDDIDSAAVAAASKSTYKPAMHDCKQVDGTYIFMTTVSPD